MRRQRRDVVDESDGVVASPATVRDSAWTDRPAWRLRPARHTESQADPEAMGSPVRVRDRCRRATSTVSGVPRPATHVGARWSARRRRRAAAPSSNAARSARDGDEWVGDGRQTAASYGLVADGAGARFDPRKVLARSAGDRPWCSRRSTAGAPPASAERRRRARARLATATAVAVPPRAAAVEPCRRSCTRRTCVGLTSRRPSITRARIVALIERARPHSPPSAFSVIELLPVHQNDPQEGSYWGYMPLAFGAVARSSTPPATTRPASSPS